MRDGEREIRDAGRMLGDMLL
eukprot:COSAG04_NODE_16395_length_500_cov_1.099751_1_plen_20_part_10